MNSTLYTIIESPVTFRESSWTGPPKIPYPYDVVRDRATTPPDFDEVQTPLSAQDEAYTERFALSPTEITMSDLSGAYDHELVELLEVQHDHDAWLPADQTPQNTCVESVSSASLDSCLTSVPSMHSTPDTGSPTSPGNGVTLVGADGHEYGQLLSLGLSPSSKDSESSDGDWQVDNMSLGMDHDELSDADIETLLKENLATCDDQQDSAASAGTLVAGVEEPASWPAQMYQAPTPVPSAAAVTQSSHRGFDPVRSAAIDAHRGRSLSRDTAHNDAGSLEVLAAAAQHVKQQDVQKSGIGGKRTRTPSPNGKTTFADQTALADPEADMPVAKAQRCDLPPLETGWSTSRTPELGPTPVSPTKCFTDISAERATRQGRMFRVVWRESWVHEASLPSIEPVREHHIRQYGRSWDVLPPSPSVVMAHHRAIWMK